MDTKNISDDLHSTPSLEMRVKINQLTPAEAGVALGAYKQNFGRNAHDLVIQILEDRRKAKEEV